MKTTKTNKNNEIQIGDKVKFVVGTSLLTGVITKFYKNSYGDEECSVKTELNTLSGKTNQKIFPHILLHRVSKIEGKDEVEVVREMRQQIVDLEQENKQLKQQLTEKDKEINKLQQMAIIDMQTKEILELQVATIRKQVCNKIRDKLPYYKYGFQEPEVPRVDVIETKDIEFILDQIEQGEQVKENIDD